MMKILKSYVLCVEIKCPGTIMVSLPVKAARFAFLLLPKNRMFRLENKPLDYPSKLNLSCFLFFSN